MPRQHDQLKSGQKKKKEGGGASRGGVEKDTLKKKNKRKKQGEVNKIHEWCRVKNTKPHERGSKRAQTNQIKTRERRSQRGRESHRGFKIKMISRQGSLHETLGRGCKSSVLHEHGLP